MTHECPECGLTCHCHGDIGDCLFENTYAQMMCDHCGKDDYDLHREDGDSDD